MRRSCVDRGVLVKVGTIEYFWAERYIHFSLFIFHFPSLSIFRRHSIQKVFLPVDSLPVALTVPQQ
jgi:hypothetical protein